MKPWEQYQNAPQAAAATKKPWELYGGISEPEKPTGKNWAQRQQEDFNKRKADIQASQLETQLGKRSNAANFINATGQGVALLGDTAGNLVGSAARYLPQGLKDAAMSAGQAFVGGAQSLGEMAGEAMPQTGLALGQGVDYVKGQMAKRPITTDIAENLLNITSVAPVGAGVKRGGQAVVDVATNPQVLEAAGKGAMNTLKMTGEVVKSPVTLANKAFPAKAPILGSDEIAKSAGNLYKLAAEQGGVLKPEVTNRFISNIESLAPQTEMGKVLAGDNTFTNTLEKIKSFRDKPIDLDSAQEIDEYLGDIIDSEIKEGRLSKQGKKVLDIQNTFRDSIDAASEAEVIGGKSGFEALKQARAEWSKAARTRDIERIITRAEQTDNPATSIKAGFRTLANNPKRMNSYPPKVQVAIRNAAQSGAIPDFLRTVVGSRLISGLVGASGGGIGGAVAGEAASIAARKGAAAMQLNKAQKVLRMIQEGKKPTPAEIGKLPAQEGKEVMGYLKQMEKMTPEQQRIFIEGKIGK